MKIQPGSLDSSTSEEDPDSKEVQPHGSRSSERILKRRNREFRLPTREEALGVVHSYVSPEKALCESTPKRLINDFMRGTNRYNAERFDNLEGESDVDDFIISGEGETSDSSMTSSDGNEKRCRLKRSVVASSDTSDSDSPSPKSKKKACDNWKDFDGTKSKCAIPGIQVLPGHGSVLYSDSSDSSSGPPDKLQNRVIFESDSDEEVSVGKNCSVAGVNTDARLSNQKDSTMQEVRLCSGSESSNNSGAGPSHDISGVGLSGTTSNRADDGSIKLEPDVKSSIISLSSDSDEEVIMSPRMRKQNRTPSLKKTNVLGIESDSDSTDSSDRDARCNGKGSRIRQTSENFSADSSSDEDEDEEADEESSLLRGPSKRGEYMANKREQRRSLFEKLRASQKKKHP